MKQVYHCLACNTYLHEDCMSSREWETVLLHDHLEERQHLVPLTPEDLESERSGAIQQYYEEMHTERTTASLPPWRCAECTTNRQFAMTRILELFVSHAGGDTDGGCGIHGVHERGADSCGAAD